MSDPSLLVLDDIRAGYDGTEVLHGVSLEVHEEDLVCLVGPNGSGKSTLLKVIFGLIKPDSGGISYCGRSLLDDPPEIRLKRGLSYVPQHDHVFPSMTVRENLEMGAFSLSRDVEERIHDVIDVFPELHQCMNQRAGTLSGGQQQMLALGRGLMVDPALLLLDEPTAALQPSLVSRILDTVRSIHERGVSIVMVAQTLDALECSHRAYLLSSGEIQLSGPTSRLREDRRLQELYFGAGTG